MRARREPYDALDLSGGRIEAGLDIQGEKDLVRGGRNASRVSIRLVRREFVAGRIAEVEAPPARKGENGPRDRTADRLD